LARIEKISIRGYKSIDKLALDIKDINVLIGGNGSGKSNFISVFKFLREITEGRLENFVKTSGGADSILHFGAKRTPTASFHIRLNDDVDQYNISLSHTVGDGLVPVSETAYFWNKSYPRPLPKSLSSVGVEAGISAVGPHSLEANVQDALGSWRVYHFHDTSDTSPLKKTAKVDDNRFFRADGGNLAAFLYLLKKKHEEYYFLIRNTIRRVAPFFDDFVLEPRTLDEESIRLEWKHKGTDAFFGVSSFSDGTLRFIALTVLLLQPNKLKPSVILLDEPELGLHPSAITVLGALIRQASHDVQVIISTQSPTLLDSFDPEEVVVVQQDAGASTFERLVGADLEEWLEEFSLGALWEKNEIGGKPGGA
jgi:predicted ATPase